MSEKNTKPTQSLEFICEWFELAAKNAKTQNKADAAALWQDGLDQIRHFANLSDDLAAALLAILREVTPGPVPPFSADSHLPAHLIEQARAALEKAGAV